MDAQAKIEEAKAVAAQNHLELAQTILNDLIQQDPLNAQAWLAKADVVENPNEAMQCLERALKLQPGNELARQKLNKLRDPFADLFTTSYSGYEQKPVAPLQTSGPIETPPVEPFQASASLQSKPFQANTYQPRSTNQFETPQVRVPTPERPPFAEPPTLELQSQRFQEALATTNISIEQPRKKSGNCILISVLMVIIMALGVVVLYLIVQNPSILNLGSEQTAGGVFDMVHQNMAAANAEDIDSYMETIHPKASGRLITRTTMKSYFGDYDLLYSVAGLEVLEKTEEEARITFELTTRKISGPAFQDNCLSGIMVLRLDDGKWKIYDQEILDVVYLK